MNTPFRFLFIFLIASLIAPYAFGQNNDGATGDNDEPVRALLITGGGWHDYETQEKLLTEGMSERINIEWTVIHEGDRNPDYHVSVFQKENWTEGYDVVVHNTGFGRVTDPGFVEQLVEGHIGTPAVLIHASVHSYRYAEPADPWFEFMGLQSMWHEGQRPFEVQNINSDHPIMQSLPETWAPGINDELYVIEEVWGEITPLEQGYGQESENYQVVSWTHEFENTRIFCTTLGHNNEMFEQDVFLDKIANGILWAVNRLE